MVPITELVDLLSMDPWGETSVTLERKARLLVLHPRQEVPVPNGSVVLPALELVVESVTDASIA